MLDLCFLWRRSWKLYFSKLYVCTCRVFLHRCEFGRTHCNNNVCRAHRNTSKHNVTKIFVQYMTWKYIRFQFFLCLLFYSKCSTFAVYPEEEHVSYDQLFSYSNWCVLTSAVILSFLFYSNTAACTIVIRRVFTWCVNVGFSDRISCYICKTWRVSYSNTRLKSVSLPCLVKSFSSVVWRNHTQQYWNQYQ